jgi:hypothetical protein
MEINDDSGGNIIHICIVYTYMNRDSKKNMINIHTFIIVFFYRHHKVHNHQDSS